MNKQTRSRRRVTKIGIGAAAAALVLAGCGEGGGDTEGGEETQTLTYVGFTTLQSGNTDIPNWWMDEIEERTNGELAFDRYHQGTLCADDEIADCIIDGRADAGVGVPSFTPAYFPVTDLISIPFAGDDNGAVISAFSDLYENNEIYRAETEDLGLKLFGQWPADRLIFGSEQEIDGPDDMQGVSFRVLGLGTTVAFDEAGAEVVSVTTSEMYEAVQRGVVDAWTNNFEGGPDFNLYEVSSHWRDPGAGPYVTDNLWFSESTWESLSPEHQAVVEEVNQELHDGKILELWNASLEGNCDLISDDVDTFTRWSDDEIEKWEDMVGDKAEEAWIDSVVAAGIEDPDAILEEFRGYLDAYDPGGDNSDEAVPSCIDQISGS